MPRILVVLLACVCATPAYAQGVYVSAAAGADTSLTTDIESNFQTFADGGGTVPFFAARLGVAMSDRWGIELEAAQSLTLERSGSGPDVFARASGSPIVWSSFSTGVLLPGGNPIALAPDFSFQSKRRSFVLTPAAWVSRSAGSRVDLRFLAGAAFERTTFEERTRIAFPLPAGIPVQLLPAIAREQTLDVTTYRVGPLVGAEGWILLGNHLRVVPGVRLSTTGSGWSVRPSAAVAWLF